MKVTRTIAEMRAALAALPRPLGLVPTMGALHGGHLALVEAARESCAAVAASVFVNPSQFAPHEDLDAYPRDEARDLELLDGRGVAVAFAPSAAEMYPDGFSTEISVHGIGDRFEGASRPLFFGGVVLAVTKLLNIFQPERAFFGQKDAQQLAVVRQLVHDLNLPVEIVAVPTVREKDGLAMSSRNAYLNPVERTVAPDLYRALRAGVAAAGQPDGSFKDAIVAATAVLITPDAVRVDDENRCREILGEFQAVRPQFEIDYLAVVDGDTFMQTQTIGPRTLLIAAARLGDTRLLDNVFLSPSAHPNGGATARKDGNDRGERQ